MQFGQLGRCEFITLLGVATAQPLTAWAQQSAMPVNQVPPTLLSLADEVTT
jgi:hypothetical protein